MQCVSLQILLNLRSRAFIFIYLVVLHRNSRRTSAFLHRESRPNNSRMKLLYFFLNVCWPKTHGPTVACLSIPSVYYLSRALFVLYTHSRAVDKKWANCWTHSPALLCWSPSERKRNALGNNGWVVICEMRKRKKKKEKKIRHIL
jgi:hypothetical protein